MGAYLPLLTLLYPFCNMLLLYNSCVESLGLLGQVRMHILTLYQDVEDHVSGVSILTCLSLLANTR